MPLSGPPSTSAPVAGPTGGIATYLVAASGAPVIVRDRADYLCDGTADHVQIQAAIDALPTTGGVVALAGDFVIDAPITITTDTVTLQGFGIGSETGLSGCGTRIRPSGSFSGAALVLAADTVNSQTVAHFVMRDMMLDGSSTATGTARGTMIGLDYRGRIGLIERVFVANCATGMKDSGYSGWITYETEWNGIQIADCDVGLNKSSYSADSKTIGGTIYDCGINLLIDGGATHYYIGLHLYSGSTANFQITGGGDQSKFIGCRFEDMIQHNGIIDSTGGGFGDYEFVACNWKATTASILTNNTYNQMHFVGSNGMSSFRFIGGTFKTVTTTGTNKPANAIGLSTGVQGLKCFGVEFSTSSYSGTQPITGTASTSIPIYIRNCLNAPNSGFRGTGTVGAAVTTSAISFGGTLGYTPIATDLLIAWTGATTNDIGHWWLSGFSTTGCTLNVTNAPGGSGAAYGWALR